MLFFEPRMAQKDRGVLFLSLILDFFINMLQRYKFYSYLCSAIGDILNFGSRYKRESGENPEQCPLL